MLLLALALTSRYHLVWSDDFRKDGPPDPANWKFEHGFVRNRELQWYQEPNAYVLHRELVIEGRKEQVQNPNYDASSKDWRRDRPFADYTSACITTQGLHEWKYGRFEIRAKISAEKGMWPAIWFLGTSRPWPSCGEVDLMEFYQEHVLANTAYGTGGGTWKTVRTPLSEFTDKDKDWARKFHTWRMDWDEDSIKLSLDGRLLNDTDIRNTTNPDGFNPFHQPEYLLLNLAIGSTGGDPSETPFPAKYEIQWVRVYQKT